MANKIVVICGGGSISRRDEILEHLSEFDIDIEIVSEDNQSKVFEDMFDLDMKRFESFEKSLKNNYFEREKSLRFLNKKRKKF